MGLNNKILKYIYRGVLKVLPLYTFKKLNVIIYRKLGYKIHKTARIFSSVQILGDMNVEVGSNTFIGHETIITGGKANVIIGSNCDISDRVSIVCGTHIINMHGNRRAGDGIGKDIVIGNGVWIGYGATILPGTKIGDMSIIAAGSVVHKNVKSNTIVGGNPITELKKIDE